MTTFLSIRSAADQSAARRLASEDAKGLVVVDRRGPRSVVFQCPCGCGEILVISVDPKSDHSWRLKRNTRGISLTPSVWRTTGCKSHFVLWQNQVWWCRSYDEGAKEPTDDGSWPAQVIHEVRRAWFRSIRKWKNRK
jgi:hypothetical protein